jgi:hypothetical protein
VSKIYKWGEENNWSVYIEWMKKLFIITLLLLSSLSYAQFRIKLNPFKSCSLKDGISSDCYFKREKPVLRAAMVYYGSNYWEYPDIERFSQFFPERFKRATQGELEIEIVMKRIIPFIHRLPENYVYNNIIDPDRLQRIWYWQNYGTGVGMEIHDIFQARVDKKDLEEIDLLLVVTGAQSDGNGFAAGRVVVVEQPREVAWGLADGGWTERLSDYELSDILIHEVGHALGIGHAAEHCTERGLSYYDRLACCQQSPSGNDVMSYCRQRSGDEIKINVFEECTLNIIKEKIKPRILSGGKRRINEEIHCR